MGEPQQVSLSVEVDGKPMLHKWEDKYVLLLIDKYSKSKHLFKKPRATKKEVFETITQQFNEEADVLVDGNQCMRKWFKLENQFKKIEDNNKQTGRANKSWKFYNQLEQCIGDSPRVHPAYTFDTGIIPSTSSSTDSEKSSVANSDCDDDTDGNDDECDGDDSMAKKPKTLKNRKRKRKSKSSASEMLAFFRVLFCQEGGSR